LHFATIVVFLSGYKLALRNSAAFEPAFRLFSRPGLAGLADFLQRHPVALELVIATFFDHQLFLDHRKVRLGAASRR